MRVDENRQVQTVNNNNSSNKPKGDATKFNKAMEAKQSMVKQNSSGTGTTVAKHTSPSSMMGHNGIANPFASKLAQANKAFDIKQSKMTASDKASDLDSQRATFQEDSDKQLGTRLDKQERAATEYQEARATGFNGQGSALSAKNTAAKNNDAQVQNEQNGAALNSIGANNAQAADGPTAAHTVEIPQQVLDKLVDKVSSGVTAEGLSTFQIELKDDVLKGAKISITAKDGKIAVKVDTGDTNIKRLFQASEGQLARAFDHKGLSLDSLEISQHQ